MITKNGKNTIERMMYLETERKKRFGLRIRGLLEKEPLHFHGKF